MREVFLTRSELARVRGVDRRNKLLEAFEPAGFLQTGSKRIPLFRANLRTPLPQPEPPIPTRSHQAMNATVTDIKPKTSEQVRADARRRVIANARKPAKRTSPKLPKAHPPKVPVFNSASIASPFAPVFTGQTKAKFDLAVRALKGTRSLSERLTIAACHLRGDPMLSTIDPAELFKELSQNK
jgi:hypothetical protein